MPGEVHDLKSVSGAQEPPSSWLSPRIRRAMASMRGWVSRQSDTRIGVWSCQGCNSSSRNRSRARIAHATCARGWLEPYDGWAIAPAGMRGVVNDAMAVYDNTPTCAVAFVARWLIPGDPPGFYELRPDEPVKIVPLAGHSTPVFRKPG
jgi:hypothetical protein